MARLDSFLRMVVDQKASDLHFHSGTVPIIRHDGDLVTLPFRSLSEEETARFVMEIMTPEQRAVFEKQKQIDFAYVVEGCARFRVNIFMQSRGIGSVFRVVPDVMPTLEQLRLPPAIRRLAKYPNGLVLVTGATGSGKSTTLAAMVNEVNRTMRKHIITLEDPIEFVHVPRESIVTQRQVGKHVDTFAAALRSALRESPDVVVVGEMRDFETVSLAVSAAETGVLVFGTLHTNSAAKAVDRIIDMCPEELHEQMRNVVSTLLKGVVAQSLCKRANGEGRAALTEILLNNYAVANMIRENKTFQLDGYLASGEALASGMQSLDQSILARVKEGEITAEDALRYARYPDTLKTLLATIPEDA
ncbi:MAG: type IV pilus twitching motility protein PilT [Labilithrix sp.]|nr:type IV pilus twitching motility protein PilT [Labilithrix sp.]MCW5816342.1 type IV pilus twitching motility protein PilT [Labilithrix sp.]